MDNKEMLDQTKQATELHNAACGIATNGSRINPTPLAEQVEDRLYEAIERARHLCDLAEDLRYRLAGFSTPEVPQPSIATTTEGMLPRSLERTILLLDIQAETRRALEEVLEHLPRKPSNQLGITTPPG